MTKPLPVLGQTVHYVRMDENNVMIEGDGVVHGIFIDPNKRTIIRVKDEKRDWNIDAIAIDMTPEETVIYCAHLTKIRTMADEYNAQHHKYVQDANAEIEKLNTEYMGPPFDL